MAFSAGTDAQVVPQPAEKTLLQLELLHWLWEQLGQQLPGRTGRQLLLHLPQRLAAPSEATREILQEQPAVVSTVMWVSCGYHVGVMWVNCIVAYMQLFV